MVLFSVLGRSLYDPFVDVEYPIEKQDQWKLVGINLTGRVGEKG